MASIGAVFVFFFQAEDGIRDIGVTGVQTCALPIYRTTRGWRDVHDDAIAGGGPVARPLGPSADVDLASGDQRRRLGARDVQRLRDEEIEPRRVCRRDQLVAGRARAGA